ncbi:MAG: nucleotidyl transferase AbiEii/AbiGii toxin family protein [Polyangiaceae bacterium]|nr:nucleotidyl transferase AbiEii/AbiGii toxin family protein [Polyangiaceae bacterium]
MMDSLPSGLSPLQMLVIAQLQARATNFFLTGGGVLVGWVLHHRETEDLDLFTDSDETMAEADRLARGVSAAIGADIESLVAAPDFKRFLLTRGNEAVKLDFVRDRAPQLRAKVAVSGLLMDPVEEILINKLCALAGRAEVRDLVDLQCLADAGYDILKFLPEAELKDAGATPATLAWLLSTLRIPDEVPGPHSSDELRRFAKGLEAKLRALAAPR